MRRILFIVFAVTIGSSCSQVHYLDSMDEEEARFFEERAKRKLFSVHTYDGSVFAGSELVVETDTIAWIDSESGEPVQIGAQQVQQIVFVSKSTGATDGFLIGLSIGAAIGGVMGYTGGEDCSEQSDFICISRGGGAILGALIIGIPAGVIGGIIGYGKATTHTYHTTSSEPTSVVSPRKRGETPGPSN